MAPAAPSSPWLALREELLLHPAPRQHDGSPAWSLEDPGRGQFFQIGWAEAEMLSHWHLGNALHVATAVSENTPLVLDHTDVEAFQRFLAANQLLQARGEQQLARLADIARRQQQVHWFSLLLRHYLFFRIPLWQPDNWLQRQLGWVRRWLITPGFARLTVLAGSVGLFLAARQWDTFTHTFLHFFTLEGAALAGLTLMTTKILHEMGHAFAARHFGCRVSTMGVAVMVMWPVLYTDTSGAWRLSSRRQRLLIGAAGMLTETALAAWATLAWSFLPDGMLRSAAFMLATTTWLLTLAINLNPLMRFDGYFLLSDALNVPNLQHRAFELTRWQLREWLFQPGHPALEHFSRWRHGALLGYSLAVWLYRLFLYLGIALLVYHFAFKVVGILLFIVEMGVFLLRPLYQEARVWAQLLGQHPFRAWSRRAQCTALAFIAAILTTLLPWQNRIEAPALLRASQQIQLQTPAASQIEIIHVHPGQRVKKGDPLFTLRAPELEHELTSLEQRIAVLRWQQSFQGISQSTAVNVPVAERELQAAQTRYAALAHQHEQLTIRAAFDGTIMDQASPLAAGEWLASGEWLGTLATPDQPQVEAYVSEADIQRLHQGATARFVPEDTGSSTQPVVLSTIASTATRRLGNDNELVSPHGGGIAAKPAPHTTNQDDSHQMWLPEQSVYRVLLHPPVDTRLSLIPSHMQRGTVIIQGEAQSPAGRVIRQAISLLVRESGF